MRHIAPADTGDDEGEGLMVRRIRNGTVIDHIVGGEALNVIKILGIAGTTTETLSIATNVPSKHMGTKDIVKISNRELSKEEVDRIALISPRATINIVRDFKVCEKKGVEIPTEIVGSVRCPNPGCITRTSEPIRSRFAVLPDGKGLRCTYCDSVITKDLTSYII
ncbi:aspartate carbamoyltransferase regulatory subunit [Methanoregula sp.]|uniref:aspartate carbamoyltransferase regulatory subunit n=1 Tax=Methanoregula sp. TaxID=2052170 RepID=UPI002C09D2E9|nr:aspartate carbamoyltransferase regulatory subunit [Methanoregula sp.]HVP95585.1 aspartate carbamoyltransferase regulatory subunit [Methanoregula sp.]